MKKLGAKKEFRVYSDLALVQKTSLEVLEFLKPLKLSDAVQFDVRLCMEEALINAMKYGNGLKKELPVDVSVVYDSDAICMDIQDEGPGFDVAALEDCTRKDNLLKGSGRGVFLIHRLMDKIEYNSKGNKVSMTKFLNEPACRQAGRIK